MLKTTSLYRLIWMSRPLMQSAEAAVEQGLQGTGISVRMRAVLEILHVFGTATVPDIAHRLEIQRQYVQVMVNETLAANLTEKRDNPRHKRSTLIALTEHGRSLIDEIVLRERALLASLSDGLNASEVETALSVVSELTERLKASTQSPDK